MSRQPAEAELFLRDLRASMRKHNVYRGQVLSLEADRYDTLRVRLHNLPHINPEQIILPAGLLDRIERQTVRFAMHREKLLAADAT